MIRKEYKKLALTSSQDKVFFKTFVVTFADRYFYWLCFCWSLLSLIVTLAGRWFCGSLLLWIGEEGGNLLFCMKFLAVAGFLTVHDVHILDVISLQSWGKFFCHLTGGGKNDNLLPSTSTVPLPLTQQFDELAYLLKKGKVERLMLTTFDLWEGQGRRHDISLHRKCKSTSFYIEIDQDRCRRLDLWYSLILRMKAERRARVWPTSPVQYLDSRSHGQNLRSTSGGAEPIANYFLQNLTSGE
jgi:hypothetical protein